jgi:hypothetical protein
MLLLYKGLVGSILDYVSVCYFGMARTHFLRGLRINLGLIQSTPNNSLGVLGGVSPLAERCMYLKYRYLVTVFHKHGHPLRERLETLNRLNSERCLKMFTFQPSRTYAQYDLAALVSVPDIDETMTVALASVDKSMYQSVASRELATITSDYPTENIFYTDGSMIGDVAEFAVHNSNYETGHQLAKPSSVFSAETSAIRMALEHIQICPRGRYLILSDSLSSLMAMRSRRITCKTHPWVYESKQIYWDL